MKKKTPKEPAAAAHMGIDLAKDKFDAVLFTAAGTWHHKVFPNTAEGLKDLAHWLGEHRVSLTTAVMEATGVYWEEVAAWLHARAHTVHVLNPAQARRFAESQLCRQKTDAVDAAILCRMARISVQCEFTRRTPPAAERLELRRLTRGRESLVGSGDADRCCGAGPEHRTKMEGVSLATECCCMDERNLYRPRHGAAAAWS